MKIRWPAAALALLVWNLPGFAQAKVACGQSLDAPLRSKAVLSIDSRPAGLEIIGMDEENIHVTCKAENVDEAEDIRMQFSGNQDDGKLTITGGATRNGNFRVRIEVPRKTSLKIQMPAGEVKVEEIAGDKDIDLYAGLVTISSARAWDYRSVDLSVDIGEVKAPLYSVDKGGFFRTFRRRAADGEYWLHAHVMTGEIELLGRGEAAE
jgi:hypothetical protein